MKRILHLTILCLLLSSGISAQVTIGSGEKPVAGALLDLKDGGSYGTTGATAVKGLGMPRVKLESLTKLKMGDNEIVDGSTNEYTKHIGLIVYNTNPVETANRLCPGLHVWDGTKWQPLSPYPDWSATPPTVVGTPVVEISRTPIVDPLKPLGHLGYLEDVRGPLNDGEYNRYAYARSHLDKLETKTATSYTGQKPWGCVAKNEAWTEVIETETIDEGTFMTQNMNTRYFPDNTLINGGVPSATTVATNAQFAYPQSAGGAIQAQPTNYWDKSQGLVYNYKAAVNKDIGNASEGATAHEVRQGICPTGWHVPSDMEFTAFTASLGGDAVAGTPLKSLTRLAGTVANPGGSSASADMGGFNLLLAGRANNDVAGAYGNIGYLWSSSSYNTSAAWYRNVGSGNAYVYRGNNARSDLYSVRCKKN